MKIAIVQMKVVDGDGPANFEHAAELILAHSGADLYLLPEVWTTGYARSYWPDYVKHHHATVIKKLQALANEQQCFIAGSMIVPTNQSKMVNRLIVLAPGHSKELMSYDKAHLFTPMEEDKYLEAGDKRVHGKMGDWEVGLSICYDLRFPAAYRRNAAEGAQLFLIPSQWPTERCDLMVALARARAIENQAYLALSNRIGRADSGLEFGGRSGLWGPDGTQLADAGEREEILTVTIERAPLDSLRREFPVLSADVKGVDY